MSSSGGAVELSCQIVELEKKLKDAETLLTDKRFKFHIANKQM